MALSPFTSDMSSDPLPPYRHYMEQTGTTANSGGVYTLTVADVVGKDRGSIPITIMGADKQEHRANIKIYVIGTKCNFNIQYQLLYL